jgi:tripartite-type tricarboxylate transporter receptor subunit TctC
MPGLPTIAESGLPGFDVTSWYGVIAPAGTPDAIISKVQGDIAATLRVPAVHDRLAHEGAEPVGSTPAQFAKLLADEMRKWSAVVKAAHVKPESY